MNPGDSSKKREQHRAELIHAIFSKVAASGLTHKKMFRLSRKLAGSGQLFRSHKRWESLFLAWKKNPRPKTVLRKWNSRSEESSGKFVPAVVAFSLAARVTLHEAQATLGLPVSHSTLVRHCKTVREISRLAALSRAKDRIEREEKTILKMISGGKRQ